MLFLLPLTYPEYLNVNYPEYTFIGSNSILQKQEPVIFESLQRLLRHVLVLQCCVDYWMVYETSMKWFEYMEQQKVPGQPLVDCNLLILERLEHETILEREIMGGVL